MGEHQTPQGRQDAKRAKFWTKILREVQVAAKLGGPDPDANPRLRVCLNDARSHNIPKDTIKRAIEKGAGIGGSEDFVELVYEGTDPARWRCSSVPQRQPQPDGRQRTLDLQ